MNKDLRIGIAGVGPHFRETLFSSLLAQNGCLLTAFCDRKDEAGEWVKARFLYPVVVRDINDKAFWDAIDCVVCCGSPQLHESAIELACKYGKHCFCEKPAGLSAQSLGRIIQCEREGKELVMRVGHVFRYTGGARQFIEIANRNALECLQVTYLGSGPSGSRWDLDSLKAFSLTHLTHAVDFITAIAGDIVRIQGAVWCRGFSGDGPETLSATFRTQRCGLISLFATNGATAFTCGASAVTQDGGLLHLDGLRNVSFTGKTVAAKRSGEVWRERNLGTTPQNDGYADELRDFFREVRGEKGVCRLPDLFQARHVLEIIEELERRS